MVQNGTITRAASRVPAPTAIRDPQSDITDDFPEVPGYDLIDLVGRGGMGVVYEAIQRSTGRRCAVKLLGDRTRRQVRERFEREVALSARLNHANIVRVFDAGPSNGPAFYAMEFIDGRPLDEALRPGHARPRDIAAMMARICDAVDYAHQRGVLHRD